MWDSRFSRRWKLRLRSSGTRGRVGWWIGTNVQKERAACIFRVDRRGRFSETLLQIYRTKHHHIPEDRNLEGLRILYIPGGEWSASDPDCFTPHGKTAPRNHWIGGWMGLWAYLDLQKKRNNPPSLQSSKLIQTASFWLVFGRCLVCISARTQTILTDSLRGFHESLEKNVRAVPRIRPRPLPSTSFSIQYSLSS
jgi:hypothetical protein